MAAVVSILRRTRRLVSSGIPAVISRNGTSAIFGPDPDQEEQERVDDEGDVQRLEFHSGCPFGLRRLRELDARASPGGMRAGSPEG